MKIVNAGALDGYVRLLQSVELQEQILSSAGLWILAFNDDNKRKIQQYSHCLTGKVLLIKYVNVY